MGEQAKTEEEMAAKIKELEERVRAATERARRAEKERDGIALNFLSSITGPFTTQPLSTVKDQGQWPEPFSSSTPVTSSTTSTIVGQGAERAWQGIKSRKIETAPQRALRTEEGVSSVSHQPVYGRPFPPPPPYPSPSLYQPPVFPSSSTPIISTAPEYPAPFLPYPYPTPQVSQPAPPRPYNLPKKPRNQNNHQNRGPLPPLPIPLGEIYQHLLAAGQIAPTPTRPQRPPYPKWFDPNTRCEYHAGVQGHALENCIAFKGKLHHLIKSGWVSFESPTEKPNTTTDPLPGWALSNGRESVISREEIVDSLVSRLTKEELSLALARRGYVQRHEDINPSPITVEIIHSDQPRPA